MTIQDNLITQSLNRKITQYIGIDIGTTSAKAITFSEKGEVMSQENVSYPMLHLKSGYVEQDPEQIFQVFDTVLKKAVSLASDKSLIIALSSAMHSFMAVDKNGIPLTKLMIWADNRADEEAKTLKKTDLGKKIYKQTGTPIHAFSFFPKLLWLKKHEPEIYRKAHKFIGIKEYIWFKLFGEFKIDISLASATGMLNFKTLKWDELALQTANISEKQLPALVPINYKEQLKNNAKNPIEIFIGASDGPLANLGTGATEKGKMALTIGTSGAIRIASKKPYTDSKMRTFNYLLDEKTYIIGGATNSGAVVLQWLKDDILKSNESVEGLIEKANKINAGAEGLIFLPYILGERAPIWNTDAKGVFFGLSKNHTQAHLVRAVLEGIVLNMFSIGKILMQKEEINEIMVSGGFAKSKIWLQIVADIFQKKVTTSETIEGSAWGAVLIAKGELNAQKNKVDSKFNQILPNLSNKTLYQSLHKKFEQIYERLKPCF